MFIHKLGEQSPGMKGRVFIPLLRGVVVLLCCGVCEPSHQRHRDHRVFFFSYLLKISQGEGRPCSKDRNMPALSDGGPDIARVILQKPHSSTEATTITSQWLQIQNICSRLQRFILSISATKQDGTADPSSRVECLQPRRSRFRVNSLYKVDALVFLLAINRSNASHSQLDGRRADGDDTRRTVSQQARLDLAGCLCRTSLPFYF